MRRSRVPTRGILALLTCLALPVLVACDGGGAFGGAADAVTVRDSAGIRIVESGDSAWTERTRWVLADAPDFVIGSLDGSVPGTDFGGSISPRLLGDRVIVLDTSNGDVRLFDREGAFVRTVGRRGQGPSELGAAGRMATFGDSVVVVWDRRGRKVVRFDLAADSVSSRATGEPPESPADGLLIGGMSGWAVRDWFGDESYVVTTAITSLSGHPPGRSTLTDPWHRISASGEHLSEIGELPSRELWSNDATGTGMAFTPVGILTPLDSTLLQAYPMEGFEFTERRPDGSIRTIVRAAMPRRPVTDALIAALRESEEAFSRASLETASEFMRERLEAMAELRGTRPFPDSVAPFNDLMTTPSGHVLAELTDPGRVTARRPDAPDPPRIDRWVVFDPDGRWLGTLEGPEGLEVVDIGDDALVGVRRDEFDVPYVERWRIVRP